MLTTQRKQLLLTRLQQDGQIVAKAFSEELGISEDTVRRDLRELAAEGRLQRVHGGALPASVLSSKGKLAPGRAEEIQDSIEISPGGIMVLDGTNWEWTPISIPPADMMFLDAIEATANQIAAIFRVDPEDVGGKPNSSLKYSTVEGNQRKLNVRTLLSWVRRFEQGLRPLMDDPTTEFLRFNLDDLARPDAMTRIKIESEQLSSGTLLLDEARINNGRDPLTAEQVADWQAWYRNKQGAPADLTDQIRAVIADINKKGD